MQLASGWVLQQLTQWQTCACKRREVDERPSAGKTQRLLHTFALHATQCTARYQTYYLVQPYRPSTKWLGTVFKTDKLQQINIISGIKLLKPADDFVHHLARWPSDQLHDVVLQQQVIVQEIMTTIILNGFPDISKASCHAPAPKYVGACKGEYGFNPPPPKCCEKIFRTVKTLCNATWERWHPLTCQEKPSGVYKMQQNALAAGAAPGPHSQIL